MALRLIEMVLAEKDGGEVRELLKEHHVLEHRQLRLADNQVLVRILLDAEQSEAALDALKQQSSGGSGNRVVILPVEATLPRAEPEPADAAEPAAAQDKAPERIGREELYEDIKNAARCSRVYLDDGGSPPSWRPSACTTTAWPWAHGRPPLLRPRWSRMHGRRRPGPRGGGPAAMAAVINELVAQRKVSRSMMEAQPALMGHMMHHMGMPGPKGATECPMMKTSHAPEPRAEEKKPSM